MIDKSQKLGDNYTNSLTGNQFIDITPINEEFKNTSINKIHKMSTTKIIVCCHKPDKFISDNVYMPIQVGKAISKFDLGIQGDNTGDNISKENPNFCELTGLYWAWKNMKPVDYIGLCHYRRYFNFHERSSAFSGYSIRRTKDMDKIDFSIPDLDELFSHYDIVMTKPEHYPYPLAVDYAFNHVSEDLRTLFAIVNDLYPSYNDAMYKVFFQNNRLSHYNMMIMRWNDFQGYCKWLFDILFEARKRINISNYDTVQARIWGYMGERLLSVYVLGKNMKQKFYPVFWINDEKEQKPVIKRIERYIRKQISFNMMRSYHANSQVSW